MFNSFYMTLLHSLAMLGGATTGGGDVHFEMAKNATADAVQLLYSADAPRAAAAVATLCAGTQ